VGGGLGSVGLFSWGWLAYGEVLAHFFEFFGSDAFDGQKVVDAFRSFVGAGLARSGLSKRANLPIGVPGDGLPGSGTTKAIG
jgi:hypothetical protein